MIFQLITTALGLAACILCLHQHWKLRKTERQRRMIGRVLKRLKDKQWMRSDVGSRHFISFDAWFKQEKARGFRK